MHLLWISFAVTVTKHSGQFSREERIFIQVCLRDSSFHDEVTPWFWLLGKAVDDITSGQEHFPTSRGWGRNRLALFKQSSVRTTMSQTWKITCNPRIQRLRYKDYEFEVSLDYMMRLSQSKQLPQGHLRVNLIPSEGSGPKNPMTHLLKIPPFSGPPLRPWTTLLTDELLTITETTSNQEHLQVEQIKGIRWQE